MARCSLPDSPLRPEVPAASGSSFLPKSEQERERQEPHLTGETPDRMASARWPRPVSAGTSRIHSMWPGCDTARLALHPKPVPPAQPRENTRQSPAEGRSAAHLPGTPLNSQGRPTQGGLRNRPGPGGRGDARGLNAPCGPGWGPGPGESIQGKPEKPK